jgi:16S rRNA (guanine966-N2)-methyltransferase
MPGLATRPTADRVKEALFSILGGLEGTRVLDLYAGTGSLGIEALSRGAENAVFVESGREALRALRENLTALGLESRSHVLSLDVSRARATVSKHGPFDVVFADPPYKDFETTLPAIADIAGELTNEGVVVVEHAARDVIENPALEAFDTRRYGDTALTFLRKKAA